MGYRGMGVRAATLEPKEYFLVLYSSNTPILGIRKYLCWPIRYRAMGVSGRHPRTRTIVFGIVQFKQPHRSCPKTPLLAYRVQWYGCFGRNPKTRAIGCRSGQRGRQGQNKDLQMIIKRPKNRRSESAVQVPPS